MNGVLKCKEQEKCSWLLLSEFRQGSSIWTTGGLTLKTTKCITMLSWNLSYQICEMCIVSLQVNG